VRGVTTWICAHRSPSIAEWLPTAQGGTQQASVV